MKSIALSLATNIAFVLVFGITLRILGVEHILDEQGAGRYEKLFMSHPSLDE